MMFLKIFTFTLVLGLFSVAHVSPTLTPVNTILSAPYAVAGNSVELENPSKLGSIQALLGAILNIVMILMVPVIVFFIILAGFKYVTAGGNASQVEEASRALLYAIIGGVLILGAMALSQIIANVVDQF